MGWQERAVDRRVRRGYTRDEALEQVWMMEDAAIRQQVADDYDAKMAKESAEKEALERIEHLVGKPQPDKDGES